MTSSGTATVKAVISGDTLLLMGRATGGAQPPELQLTLSSLMAPKLARSKDNVEEPFALESREFLRKLCIGKQVTFRVEYKVMAIGRTFGAVILDGENLCVRVAREGWARVKPLDSNREGQQSSDYEAMVTGAAAAEAARKGVYGTGGIRQVLWEANAEALLRKHRDQPVAVVIEHLRDGAAFKCSFLDSGTHFTFNLAGVVCPRMNIGPPRSAGGHNRSSSGGAVGSENGDANGGGEATRVPPEPYAEEAKHFTEVRLLNRDVMLMFEGVDKNILCGTVLHPMGNISVELLRHGLARMSDFTSGFCSRANAAAMRAAENEAKAARLRIWRTWTPPQIQGDKEYSGTVVEVFSGDQISVLVDIGEGRREERRVMLSSVRAPRGGRGKRGGGGPASEDEPWAHEAKESLRTKTIGKVVRVVVDYDRDMKLGEADTVRRSFATVYVGKGKGKNVAEMLLAEGLLNLAKHRADDPKAAEYDRLAAAEAEAKAAKKGVFAPPQSAPPPPRYTDVSMDMRRARNYLGQLQRGGAQRALVENVFNGSRFKLFIPKENLMLLMAISGVRCPQVASAARPGIAARPAELLAEEARMFAREHVMQRAVEVEILDMDKNGMALGALLVGQGEDRHHFARDLLRMGLARVDERAMDRTAQDVALVLRTAEAAAKQAGAGIWGIEDANAAADAAAAAEAAAAAVAEQEPTTVRMSEICDGGRFFVQPAGEAGVAALREIDEKMRQLGEAFGTARGAPLEPRKGLQCAALFDAGAGPSWFRARVDGVSAAGVRVTYVDHGNVATVPTSSLTPLSRSFFRLPEQARECTLALLKVPALDQEYGRDAAIALNEMAWGRDLAMRVLGRDENRRAAVVLYESTDAAGPTINEALVREGLARFSKRAERGLPGDKAQELATRLKEAQEAAHKARVNLWRYGDVGSDDED